MSLSSTRKLCDDGGIGNKAKGLLKGATMLGVGAVTGGAAFAARGGIGKMAAGRISKLESEGAGTTARGRLELKALKSIQNTKFGMKEGYQDRKERIAKEEEAHIRSIPEYAKRDSDGHTLKDASGNVIKYNKKEIADKYIENTTKLKKDEFGNEIRKASLLNLVMGRAAGIEKGISDYKGREGSKAELGELRAKTAAAKQKMDEAKEKLKGDVEEVNDFGEKVKREKTEKEKEDFRKEFEKTFVEHEEIKQKVSDKKEKSKYTPPKKDKK